MLGSVVTCHFPGSSYVTRQLVELETVCPQQGASAARIISRYFSDLLSTVMLRIRRVSGDELTIALDEDSVPDVRALKQHLNQLYGLPPRFRQRLLLHGECLEDTDTLHSAMELELVVLAFVPNPSPDEVQEFTAAAYAGDFDKVSAQNETRFPHTTSLKDQMNDVFGALYYGIWTIIL